MSIVVTGLCKMNSKDAERAIGKLSNRIGNIRFFHNLEQLAVATAGMVLNDAGIISPLGRTDVGIFMGIDGSLEDIKNEYFYNILNEGILGASPIIFPFTAPNALAAQISIVFDIRGESITIPIERSYRDVINYATECIAGKYVSMAIAGWVTLNDGRLSAKEGRYGAEFYFLEDSMSADIRKARTYDCNEIFTRYR